MDRRKALKRTGLFAGAVIALPSALSLLQSCKNEKRLTWKPLFFTEVEALTIAALVDIILPRTSTPGALDVNVDIFIDKVIAKTSNEDGQLSMKNSIASFNADCKKVMGAIFSELSEKKQKEVVMRRESDSGKFNYSIWGTKVGEQKPVGFYRSLKAMAIWAYFTSEEIGEHVLSYDPIPQNYEGCKPLSEIGNRWSL